MPLLPLDERDLRDDERGEEDEHHLGVHGLVAVVLLVHLDVLQPGKRNKGIDVENINANGISIGREEKGEGEEEKAAAGCAILLPRNCHS